MSKKNAALEYAAIGWLVMPLHTVNDDGSCDCNRPTCSSPGKHPRTMHGLKDATTDTARIENWWTMWPHANIGVVTGQESGIIVIDVDDISLGGLEGKDIPATVTQETGSGGTHYIYRHPRDRRVKSTTKVLPGVDSRADGGYIVVPPSNHVAGYYRWTIPPAPGSLADPPAWWLAALAEAKARTEVPQDGEKIYPGGRNAALASFAGALRRMGAGYQAIHAAVSARNDEACEPPLESWEVTQIARSISQYEIETADEKQLKNEGAMIASRLLKTNQDSMMRSLALDKREITEAGPPPDTIVPAGGLIYDITQHILSASTYPQPILAVAAATAFVGALAGRRYQTETGLRSNVYFVGLARSGAGKDAARKVLKNIGGSNPELQKIMGGDRIASGTGLISALEEHPVKLFLLDEFGLLLQSMTGTRADAHRRDIITNLMQFYSDAGSVFLGTEYADKKMRKREPIHDPCAVLYATSTHQAFYRALSSQEAVSGAVARLMVVDAGETRPVRQTTINIAGAPPELLQRVSEMINIKPSGNLSMKAGGASDPMIVRMTPEVLKAWHDLDGTLSDRMTSETSASIYSRVAENAAKLALIHAVARDPRNPLIEETSFTWAREIALWSANLMLEQLNKYLADNETERTSKALELEVKAGGYKGRSKTELGTLLSRIRPYEQKAYLESLVETGRAVIGLRPTGGRPATVWIHASHAKEAKEKGLIE
ncbi:MAG: bifunctional DNA primase/polymerase [Proteiniphilum sp.]